MIHHLSLPVSDLKRSATFHEAALAHGGRDNGGSMLNPEYGPDYYAAFVFDPDGYRMEAVISPHNHH